MCSGSEKLCGPPSGLHFKIPVGVLKTARMVPTARVLKEGVWLRTVASEPARKTRYEPGMRYMDESLIVGPAI